MVAFKLLGDVKVLFML